jgi:hypothetical protein
MPRLPVRLIATGPHHFQQQVHLALVASLVVQTVDERAGEGLPSLGVV